METGDFLTVLDREGELLIDAAGRAGADAAVPSCPGWRMRDLVLHQGNIHRWATGFVAGRLAAFVPVPAERVADGELESWFRDGHGSLMAALSGAAEDLECWAFLPGARSPRHFWARRQAHETTVHRIDAELAAGGAPTPVRAEVAADGIDELLTGFHGRERSRVRSERPCALGVRATDAPGAWWRVLLSGGPPRVERGEPLGPVECEISGPAEALYQALWNRRPFGGDGVRVAGDGEVAELWRRTSAI
ncbi:maleylpyruvate isomerase family mycothiol-dependent enzyme [Streptomyces sp. 6N223]|uniref:maleylpyruvate isomerase family mycothiol-dependent enzyme n=1 Tax=Streptomyces sp. 6N223 TaxID=3457412 RepID=UPI003FD45399